MTETIDDAPTRQANTMGICITEMEDGNGEFRAYVIATDGHETTLGTFDNAKEAVACCVHAEEILGWR
jgi:hypothetical protein